MRAWVAVWLGLVAGCDLPTLQVHYRVAGDGNCPAAACADIPLPCDAYLNVRIIDPANPSQSFLSVCTRLPEIRDRTLCSIARISLDQEMPVVLPDRPLQVQVLVWDAATVAAYGGECPGVEVTFDPTRGFPVDAEFRPAFGGSVYVQPDEAIALVPLECADLSLVDNPACTGENQTNDILATVTDFDTRVSVSAGQASQLTVSVGEPAGNPDDNVVTLNAADTAPLTLQPPTAVPRWKGETDRVFQQYACVQVLQDGSRTTAAVSCQPASGSADRDLRGVRVSSPTLEEILDASGQPFPSSGLTIGMVVDFQSNPVAGAIVVPDAAGTTVRYLNETRTGLTSGATASTSANGIFVSDNAVFGTRFRTADATGAETVEAVGGGVSGKVTVVVLAMRAPPNGLH